MKVDIGHLLNMSSFSFVVSVLVFLTLSICETTVYAAPARCPKKVGTNDMNVSAANFLKVADVKAALPNDSNTAPTPITSTSASTNKGSSSSSPTQESVNQSTSTRISTSPTPTSKVNNSTLLAAAGLPNPLKDIPQDLAQKLTNPDRANNAWMRNCKNNVAICCWTQGKVANNDNSDVCKAANVQDPKKMHCHGTVFAPGRPIEEAMITMNYIQIYDHLKKRTYYGPIPGFNECDCAENMPQVRRADVSMLKANQQGKPNLDASKASNFNSGQNNDLTKTYKKLYNNQTPINPVASCAK